MNFLKPLIPVLLLCLLVTGCAQTQASDVELIAEAESAAPESVTKNATIKTSDGRVLRQGIQQLDLLPGFRGHWTHVQPVSVGRTHRSRHDQGTHRCYGVQPVLHDGW